ncbi:MAG TPA: hypothetical protein VGH54_09605 [Mycobacterium sp.]|jgi:hypothetical protein|uniref:hypothetical protein n=1 Tax=Mycobacterium sp. TaxID=1785 RepID=UPI002F41491C
MALPAEWDTRVVERIYLAWDGTPLQGTVTFKGDVPVETAAEDTVVMPKTQSATLDSAGKLSVTLRVTDDPDMHNHDFTYTVVETLHDTDNNQYNATYHVPIPRGSGALQLGTLDPIPAGAGVVPLPGAKGDTGATGATGAAGATGSTGAAGESAYQVWLDAGNTGTQADFLASLKGAPGDVSGLAVVATSGRKVDLVDYVASIPLTSSQTQAILAAKVLIACDYNAGTSSFDATPDTRLRRVFFSTSANDPAAAAQERDVWIVEAS